MKTALFAAASLIAATLLAVTAVATSARAEGDRSVCRDVSAPAVAFKRVLGTQAWRAPVRVSAVRGSIG
jgi:hypothetical protein